jgi:hypothetical protein
MNTVDKKLQKHISVFNRNERILNKQIEIFVVTYTNKNILRFYERNFVRGSYGAIVLEL